MEIIDFHTHLHDVCGIQSQPSNFNQKAHLLDRTGYNPILQVLLRSLPTSLFANAAVNASFFANVGGLTAAMESSHVTHSVVLPIEPNVSTERVVSECKNYHCLIPLMSLNFGIQDNHSLEEQVTTNLEKFAHRGIKFHPNIQNVHPLSDSAMRLYDIASSNNLFVFMHGGITPFLSKPQRYFALAKNIIPAVEKFPQTTFILGHLGQYFSPFEYQLNDYSKLRNLFLETSGASSGLLFKALQYFGPDRIIFGSDWPYGNQTLSLERLRTAIRSYSRSTGQEINQLFRKITYSNAASFLKLGSS